MIPWLTKSRLAPLRPTEIYRSPQCLKLPIFFSTPDMKQKLFVSD
jgi:hypothetical protein